MIRSARELYQDGTTRTPSTIFVMGATSLKSSRKSHDINPEAEENETPNTSKFKDAITTKLMKGKRKIGLESNECATSMTEMKPKSDFSSQKMTRNLSITQGKLSCTSVKFKRLPKLDETGSIQKLKRETILKAIDEKKNDTKLIHDVSHRKDFSQTTSPHKSTNEFYENVLNQIRSMQEEAESKKHHPKLSPEDEEELVKEQERSKKVKMIISGITKNSSLKMKLGSTAQSFYSKELVKSKPMNFMDIILKYPNLMVKDDEIIKDLKMIHPETLTTAPSSKQSLAIIRGWVEGKAGSEEKYPSYHKNCFMLATVELIRQIHVECNEKGSLLAFCLSGLIDGHKENLRIQELQIKEKAKLDLQDKMTELKMFETKLRERDTDFAKSLCEIEDMKVLIKDYAARESEFKTHEEK